MPGSWNRQVGRLITMLVIGLAVPCTVAGQAKPEGSAGEAGIVKFVGVIKSVEGDAITLSAESGGEVTAKLVGTTKILRVPPGEKDLKNATPLQAQDLQAGDRVLVRGPAAGDPHTITALAVIVMKQADVSATRQREREDWQKHGVGGLVKAIDAATGTITISAGGGPASASSSGASSSANPAAASTNPAGAQGASRTAAVRVGKNTILRRYAPGSVNFDDAKPAPFDQIKVGDQLSARGTRSADGSTLDAVEVVSGRFPYIEGTIKSIDAANGAVTVQDAIAKGPVNVKVSAGSLIWKLPPEVDQRFAARLKGISATGGGNGDQAAANGRGAGTHSAPSTASGHAEAGSPAGTESQTARGTHGGPGGNGPPDFQRVLDRLPKGSLADLQKGDAVMIVSAESGDSGPATAIKLIAGVDAILRASPDRSASSLLSPWSLNVSGGEGESTP